MFKNHPLSIIFSGMWILQAYIPGAINQQKP